jgi:hypothetical protein
MYSLRWWQQLHCIVLIQSFARTLFKKLIVSKSGGCCIIRTLSIYELRTVLKIAISSRRGLPTMQAVLCTEPPKRCTNEQSLVSYT